MLWRYHGVFAKAIVGIFSLIILLTFITALGSSLHIGKSDNSFVKITDSVVAESIPSQKKFNEIQARYNQNERKKSMTEPIESGIQ